MKYIFYILLLIQNKSLAQNQRPIIVDIYPTTDSIPANILRFYIKFSCPMQETGILKHVHLSDSNGKNITGVFFDNEYELWNNSRTEVTLLVDPGRVKTGLLAHNSMGWAFDEGKTYTLTIDSLLLDFNDTYLAKSFTKRIIAIPADSIAPDISKWSIELPKTNSKSILTVNFNDKIDHISANSLIKVIDQNKDEIHGDTFLGTEEKKWNFKPKNLWKKGWYKIIINSTLEDISANSLFGVFDHKTGTLEQTSNVQYISFQIK